MTIITSAIILYIIYKLFIKGLIFKIFLGLFGIMGFYWYLQKFDFANKICITIIGYDLSWAAIIPLIVAILALTTTKTE